MWVQITLFLLFFLISKQTSVKKVTQFDELREFLDAISVKTMILL